MSDGSTDKRSEPDAPTPKATAPKTDWVAAVNFSGELHKKEVMFDKGEDIPGNVAQETLDRWKERGLIKKA